MSTTGAPPRTSCLIVLSADGAGVSAQSFVQAFNLTHTNFSLQLASPNGKPVDFVGQDEQSRRWLTDFRSRSYSQPISLSSIDASRYSALLIPASNGAAYDLSHDPTLANIVSHFVAEHKPICAIGMGVAGLFGAKHADTKSWVLSRYSLTAPSVFELARMEDFGSLPVITEDFIMNLTALPEWPPSVFELARMEDFGSLPVITEDFIKENDAKYSSSDPDCIHVVIDRHIVTGQNVQSTLTAVQNLILLCNQLLPKSTSNR